MTTEQLAASVTAIVPAAVLADLETGALTARCLNDRHPVLAGRVLCRFAHDGSERWLPCLAHMPVRSDDQVLVMVPATGEAIVVGVIDGLRERTLPLRPAAQIELRAGESIRVCDAAGAPLLELLPRDGHLELRLAQNVAALDMPGTLRLAADVLELEARRGVHMKAGDDVVVQGESIALN